MHRWLPVFAVAFAALAVADEPLPDGLYAEIETPRGVLTAELHFRRTPLTVASFVGLADGTLGPAVGKPFFNGLTFHRVVPDFVVQGGDPLGTGKGGPGYTFPDEFVPGLRHDAAGVLSMANSGPDTNGSQFFITLRETNRLNYLHSVFGRVVRGTEVLPKIEAGDAMAIRIRRIGAAAEAFRADPDAFAALAARARKARLPFLADPDGLLPREPDWARILEHRLANFERFTGHRVYVRLWQEATATDSNLAQSARALAEHNDVARTSAVIVYRADEDSWTWWIAEPLQPLFTDARDLGAAEHRFFAAAEARAATVLANLPAEPAISPERRLKLRLDEVLNGLLHTLEDSEKKEAGSR